MTVAGSSDTKVTDAQYALLSTVRRGAKRWKELSGLRARTWERLQQLGLLTATWDRGHGVGNGDWKFEITERGRKVLS